MPRPFVSCPVDSFRRCGFTLIEMLLVVAIIVILISMLLPGFGRFRGDAMSADCKGNLQILLRGYTSYADDNLKQIMGSNCGAAHDWLAANSNVITSVTNGRLYPYVNNSAAYICPNHVYPNYLNSYSINGMLNGEQVATASPKGGSIFKKRITNDMIPGKQMVFMEEDDKRGWNINSFMLGGTGSYVDWVAANHAFGDNIGFLDGHVEYWVWTSPFLRQRPKPPPAAGADPNGPGEDWPRLRAVFRSWPMPS